MKSNRKQQSEQLVASLELSLPPIAVAFVDALPDGIPQYDGSVPAGCVFWQEAARRTFATSAEHHALCSIGIHTMNLSEAPASQPAELQAALEAMTGTRLRARGGSRRHPGGAGRSQARALRTARRLPHGARRGPAVRRLRGRRWC